MFWGSYITSSSLINSLFTYIQLLRHDDCLIVGEAVLKTLSYIFQQKHKHVFKFSAIPPHWHETGSWNPSL